MPRNNRAKHVIAAFDMTIYHREAVDMTDVRPFFVTVTHYNDEHERTMDHVLHPSKASIHRLSWIIQSALNPAHAVRWPTPLFPLRQVHEPGVTLYHDRACTRLSVDRTESTLFPISQKGGA